MTAVTTAQTIVATHQNMAAKAQMPLDQAQRAAKNLLKRRQEQGRQGVSDDGVSPFG